jgi:hypothetical protein
MFKTAHAPRISRSRRWAKDWAQICAFYDEVGVGAASRRALAAFRLGSILRLERIGLVLSMTMTDQHVV